MWNKYAENELKLLVHTCLNKKHLSGTGQVTLLCILKKERPTYFGYQNKTVRTEAEMMLVKFINGNLFLVPSTTLDCYRNVWYSEAMQQVVGGEHREVMVTGLLGWRTETHHKSISE